MSKAKDKKTKFNFQWKDSAVYPQFASWAKEVEKNKHQFFCTLCKVPMELGNMGKGALNSHMNKNEKHKKIVTQMKDKSTIRSFFQAGSSAQPAQPELPQQPSVQPPVTERVQSTLESQVEINTLKTKAEILWALKIVGSHYSFNLSQNINELFQQMFPDSEIANTVKLGKTKMSYTVNYGLAPYFKDQLLSQLKKCKEIVVCFDEAFNEISKRGQMDIVVRYWNEESNQVSTRYFGSSFMGHRAADDVLAAFLEEISELQLQVIMQVSMDGPSVNWCFYKKFNEYLQTNCDEKTLIDLGSCGLHVVHGSLKTAHAAVKWSVHQILRSLYNLFKTSPARRADLCAIAPDTAFPVKFCKVRWCGNTPACTQAIEVFRNVKVFIETSKLPSNYTVNTVKAAYEDPLSLPKIMFFPSVSSLVEPFLTKFQCNKTMVPFLAGELLNVLYALYCRFLKEDELAKADTYLKICKLDPKDS